MISKSICALLAILCPAVILGGEASGQFTAGKRPPIKPKYAAAYATHDQRDARKFAIEVVLSEEPIDVVEAAAELDPHSNVINQKALRDHNYVLLWVRPDNDVSMNATYSETMTLASARFTTTSAGAPPVKTIDPSPASCWSTGPGS